MDAKQTILEYIGPSKSSKVMLWIFFALTAALAASGIILSIIIGENWTGALLALSIVPLALWTIVASSYFSAKKHAKRCLKRLEELGQLENAAAELNAEGAVIVGNDASRLSEHFAFRKGSGVVVAFDDIRWVFIYPGANSSIPITTNTKAGVSYDPVSLANKKSNYDRIDTAFNYIAQHCKDAMVGYSEENVAKYREILKYLKAEAKAKK